MDFKPHLDLVGQHSFLGASKHAWTNYDEEKLERAFLADQAKRRGDAMHRLAYDLIKLGVNLPKSNKTINLYVNDAIGYSMIPEQPLFYSLNCFGTADTIGFRRGKLRVHDLKTGVTPTSFRQLEVYVALFCLEYGFKGTEIEVETRIYQNNEARVHFPDPDYIVHLMDKIKLFDKRINQIRLEA